MAHRKLAILRRRLFTVLSVLSLLLCVATLALWVRSYWHADDVEYARYADNARRVRAVRSVAGSVYILFYPQPGPSRNKYPLGWSYESKPASAEASIQRLAQNAGRGLLDFGYLFLNPALRAFWFPHWFLALLFAILPALHLRTLIRSRRLRRTGHCPRCGYDLRATPERCPECGLATEITENTEAG